MAKEDTKDHGAGCMCGGGMWGHHHVGHMVIKVFIVLFIFWAGVQFGELKAAVENFTGGGMMGGGWGERGNAFYGAYPVQGTMMGSTWAEPAATVTIKAVSSTTTKK